MDKDQEIKALKEKNADLETRLAKVENYTTNIGGSLEFKKIVQIHASGSTESSVLANLQVTQTLGLFGATPVGQQADIVSPTGGSVIDSEARTAIGSILTALDNFGFTA